MSQILYQPGIDNSQLAAGLNQMEAMVDAKVKSIQAKMAAAGGGKGLFSSFAGASPGLQALESQINRVDKTTQGFGRSLDRVAGVLNGGLGLGIAVGGLALLEKAFDKAINKAKQFEVAQLAIAASIASAYKLQGPGGTIEGGASFSRALSEAQKLNKEIIQRQAKNILTYEEQLGAYQSSINAGARKGFSPKQTLDVSEQLAVVAKTLGLRGEEIANASRIALGGATNISRSTIGRALGISNEDIQKRQGADLQKFLMDKTKGFQEASPNFAKSIEGVISTLEAKIDVFASKVGEKFMKKATPLIEQFGASFDSGDAEKVAQTLTDLFGAALKAIETLAKSPAIPLIMKFLEFLANFGDKILIVGALAKIASTLGGVAAGFTGFLGLLKNVASEAANAAGSVNALAAAETRAALAGGGTGAGFGSRGRAASNLAQRGGGFASVARMSGAENKALYEEALGGVGGFDMARPRTGGTTNLSWYEDKYNAAKTAHNASISKRMSDIRNKRLRQRTQEGFDESFGNFAAINERPVDTDNVKAGIAKGEAAARAERSAQMRAKVGKYGMVGLDYLQKGIGASALAFAGTELIKSQTDQSESATVRGVGGALQGGATTYAGLAAVGAGGPVGIAAAAIVAALEGLHSSLGKFDEELKKATDALDQFAKEHPNAAKASDFRNQIGELDKTAFTSGNDNSAWTNFWAGVSNTATFGGAGNYAGDTYTKNLLTDKTIQGRQDALRVKIAEERDAGRGTFIRDTREQDIQGEVKAQQDAQKGLGFGYGGKNAVAQIMNQSKLNDSQIALAAVKGELTVSDEVKSQATTIFNQYEAARNKFKAQRQADIKSGKMPAAMPDYLNKYTSQEEVEQDLSRGDLTGQNKQRTEDLIKSRQLTRDSLQAGLNPNRISGAGTKGLADLNREIIGKRGDFEDVSEYEKFAEASRKKFEHDFNEPLKRLEAKLQGLNLGVGSENVAEAADLAYKITDKKLQELVDAFEITRAQAQKLRLQAKADSVAKIAGAKFDQANQAYGGTDVARILGRERSRETVAALNQRSEMAGATGDPIREAYYKKLAEIEGKRGIFNPTQFEEFKKTSLDTFRKQMALQALGGGGLTTQEQLGRGMRDASLNMETLQKDLRQSTQNYGFETRTRPLEDALREFQYKQEDQTIARMKADQGNVFAQSGINTAEAGLGVRGAELGVTQSGLNVQAANLNARKAAIAPTLDTGAGPFGAAASAIQYKVQAEQGFNAGEYERAVREAVEIKKQEAALARQNADLQIKYAAIEQEASSLKLAAAQITYARAQAGNSQVEADYAAALENYALRLTERAGNEERIASQRAQADENFILSQEKLRNQIADLANGMEKAKEILLGNLENGKNPVSGQISGSLGNIKTINLALTLNTDVQVDALAQAMDLPDDQLDKIVAKAGVKLKQELERACKRK